MEKKNTYYNDFRKYGVVLTNYETSITDISILEKLYGILSY